MQVEDSRSGNRRKQNLARLVRGGGIYAVGDVLSLVSLTFIGIFLARLAGSRAGLGRYEFSFSVVSFFTFLTTLGLGNGAKRFIPVYQSEGNAGAVKGLLLFATRLTAVASSVIVIIIIALASVIARWFYAESTVAYIRILAIFLPLSSLSLLFLSALTAIHRVEYNVLVQKIIVPVVRLLVLAAFVFVVSQDARNAAMLWNLNVAHAIGLAVSLLFLVRKFPVLTDKTIVPEYHRLDLLKVSLPIALALPIFYLVNYIGVFIIKYYLTFDDLGGFAAAIRFSPLVIVPLLSIHTVFSPLISELHHHGRHDELEHHFKFITKWIFAFSLYIALVLIILAGPILAILGGKFNDTTTRLTLITLVLAQLFNAAAGPVGAILNMTGRQRVSLYNTIALLVLNVGLYILLVPMKSACGGIVGAGIAQATAIVGVNTLYLLQVRHYLKMHPYSLGYVKPLIAGAFSAVIVLGVMQMSGLRHYLWNVSPVTRFEQGAVAMWIVIFASALGLLYSLFIYILGLDESDRFILRLIAGRLGLGRFLPKPPEE